jgi:hypothetical protein
LIAIIHIVDGLLELFDYLINLIGGRTLNLIHFQVNLSLLLPLALIFDIFMDHINIFTQLFRAQVSWEVPHDDSIVTWSVLVLVQLILESAHPTTLQDRED